MKAVLKENLNIFLKILPLILIFVFVTSIDSSEFSVIGWLFRMIIIFLLIWKWQNKIRTQTKLRFFKLSFICTLILWIIIIALIIWKNKVGNSYIFLIGIFWFAGMVLTSKALNNSWTTIRKCNPEIRMDTEVHSLDEYFEIYSRAKNLENELSELKKEPASSIIEEAIMQREAGKLIPFFHLDMIFITLIILWGTTWL